MKIRLEIDKPDGQKPLLKGLWLQGFGWVVGGDFGGDITIYGEVNLSGVSKDGLLSLSERSRVKRSLPKIKRFLARVRKWYWNNDEIWEVRDR